jgi:hypothetical protein
MAQHVQKHLQRHPADPFAGLGVAVREFLTTSGCGEADCCTPMKCRRHCGSLKRVGVPRVRIVLRSTLHTGNHFPAIVLALKRRDEDAN